MNYDLILTADMHLRETAPTCRTDDWLKTLETKLSWLWVLQNKYKVPIVVAGDLFHKWENSSFFLNWVIENLPHGIIAIPGQHDLPYHKLEYLPKSSINLLDTINCIELLNGPKEPRNIDSFDLSDFKFYGFPFGSELKPTTKEEGIIKIAICHVMTWQKENPYVGCDADNAAKVLRKMKGYDLVVTGDNHQPFVAEEKGRLLINPGSFTRNSIDQKDYKPSVVLWNKEGDWERVYLPVVRGVINDEHSEVRKTRERRITAFVDSLKTASDIQLDFKKNLRDFITGNFIKSDVVDLIWELTEGE